VEKLKSLPLKSGMRQGFTLLPLLFNTVTDPSQSENKGKRNQRELNRERRSQIIVTCRCYDLIPKKP
jgi:hypothetical protein